MHFLTIESVRTRCEEKPAYRAIAYCFIMFFQNFHQDFDIYRNIDNGNHFTLTVFFKKKRGDFEIR